MTNGLPTAVRLMLACVLGALLVAPAAAADIRVGAADDHPKASPEIAGEFYEAMKDVGLTENRITMVWDSAHPTTIEGQDNLTAAIQDAQADGVRITLDIYPDRAKALTESRVAPARFANFVALVARTFPTVKDFIAGNEPNAGIPDLARIKQAAWDAFHGTGQPTFQEAGMPYGPARTLKLRLNEVGWQVAIPPASRGAYYGKESVVTTDEGTQAAIYGNMIPLLACDPAVESVLFFNLVDEANLDRWQSGLMRADWTRRPSYGIVKGAITAGQNRCAGRRVAWRHEYRPVGVHLSFLGGTRRRSDRNKFWSFVAGSEEGTRYTAGLYRARRPGRVAPTLRALILRSLRTVRMRGAVLRSRAKLVGGWDKVIQCPPKRLKPGYYVYGAKVVAELNPARKATFVSRPFAVGSPRR